MLAQAITTDTKGIVAGTVNVAGADSTPIPVYEAYPDQAGEFPVVMVISEVLGLHEYIRDVTRRFAKEGYYAVAPELFSREGGLAQVTDMQKVLATVFGAPLKRVVGDMTAAVEYARKQPSARPDRVGVTGFCWGGGIALTFAAFYKDTSAAVSWYGAARAGSDGRLPSRSRLRRGGRIPCPTLLLYSGVDQGIPVATWRSSRGVLKAAGRPVEKVIYPDAATASMPTIGVLPRGGGQRRLGPRLAWFQKYLKA